MNQTEILRQRELLVRLQQERSEIEAHLAGQDTEIQYRMDAYEIDRRAAE